jgi:hypothetical protein
LSKISILLCFVFFLLACTGEKPGALDSTVAAGNPIVVPTDTGGYDADSPDYESLDRLAEAERSGGFRPGMGLAESSLREDAADYAGAVIAAYKELSYAYAYSDITTPERVTLDQIKTGLNAVTSLYSGQPEGETAVRAAMAALAFIDADWKTALSIMESLFPEEDEPDSFSQWMIMAARLESGDSSRSLRSRYGAVRARYGFFPEYWYRQARTSQDNGIILESAERCINIAPRGPYAGPSRSLMAGVFGLQTDNAEALRTRTEIEYVVTSTVSSRNPEWLADLLPLLALQDNPSTLYALGALRALTAEPVFREYFERKQKESSGRLSERLLYISKG